jgi:hypothetical protein
VFDFAYPPMVLLDFVGVVLGLSWFLGWVSFIVGLDALGLKG